MDYLHTTDYAVIVVYFTILVGLAVVLSRRASASLEDYFLGGRKLPWWALGVSGMASFLDITGTMVIVSFLYLLGPRGLYIAFRGGAVLVLAFMMVWTGKWHRRSNCMTNAEWMTYRFGEGLGGRLARIMSAAAHIALTIGMLAYLVKGVGLFFSTFLPFEPIVCSLIMIGVATLYTMISGFYGVVFTDMFQSLIILVAVVTISVMAGGAIDTGDLAAVAGKVTGDGEWLSSAPRWHMEMPKGYEAYEYLILIAFFYLLRNVVAGMGMGGDPKYFGARSERECGKLTFLWTWLMTFRWPMMMGFAVLGIVLVNQLFPEQSVILEASRLIKEHVGDIDKARWEDVLKGIATAPERYPELVAGLKDLLKDGWTDKLHLVSFEGTVNPERILPVVLLFKIPLGLRGLLLVALIAASMSTFDSTVNMTSAFFTRDIYQAFLRPRAGNRELIWATYAFIAGIVAVGFTLGYYARSITEIWDWIIMGLGGGMLIPLMLRFHWWRFNGPGFAVGILAGLVAAVVQRAAAPGLSPLLQFAIVSAASLAGGVGGALLTRPTDPSVAAHFYRTTRPFGFWRPLKALLPPGERRAMEREHRNDLLAIPFALGWQVTLFLLPMQLVIGTYGSCAVTFAIFAACLVGLYFFWYRNLPPEPARGGRGDAQP